MSIMKIKIEDNTFSSLNSKAEEASTLLNAMANGKRLMVLCSLLDGEKSVGQLTAIVGLSQGALSQHLSKMRSMRLVDTRRDAQTIYYRLIIHEARKVLETLYSLYCAPET
jgi:ArsR family transcriptional regulator, virulence genes transcriptional regulator